MAHYHSADKDRGVQATEKVKTAYSSCQGEYAVFLFVEADSFTSSRQPRRNSEKAVIFFIKPQVPKRKKTKPLYFFEKSNIIEE